MTDTQTLMARATKVANELSDFNSSLDRKAEAVIRELLADREAYRAQVIEECTEAATDAVAFNGGGVQMEAHVRQAIRSLAK